MAGARWTTLAVVAALVMGVAGCGSGDSSTDVEKIALVSPGSDNEPDWTLQARAVVGEFPRDLGVRVDLVDASQADDIRAVFEQVAHEGNQLVIAHDSRYSDVAAAVAAETDVPTLVWGKRPAGDGPVAGISIDSGEGGYLAGIAAARAAVTRRLGVVVAADATDWDLANWNNAAGGFVAGARSVDPDVRVAYEQVGSDGDATPAQMHAAARRMIDNGVQMLFGLGAKAAGGALRAIGDYEGAGETLYVGIVGDKAESKQESAGVTFVLGSVMLNTRPVFRQALRDIRAGTFGDHDYTLGFRGGGIWLFPNGRMPIDAYDTAMVAKERFKRGTLEAPETPTSEDVEQLIAGGS